MSDLIVQCTKLDAAVGVACLEYCRTRNVEPINAMLRGAEGQTKENLMDLFCATIGHDFDASQQQFVGEPRANVPGEQANMAAFFRDYGGLFSQWEAQNCAVSGGGRPAVAVFSA